MFCLRTWSVGLLVAVTMQGFASLPGHATKMSPMHMEMKAGGNGSHRQFQVTNTSRSPLPIEVTYERLNYTENGQRRMLPADDNLVVFPMTALIPPGATQTFRVQWVGSPDIKRSQSYIVTARQLPVRVKNDGRSRVQVVVAFGSIVNVAPMTGSANLRLVSSEVTRTGRVQSAVAVLVENRGNIHALISDANLRVGAQSISREAMRSLVGVGVVAPGKRRRFVVPLAHAATGPVSLEYLSTRR